jgi:hypothetical protein
MEENESIPAGSESVEAQAVEIPEDVPMLDVHPPHAALHGWKDFWIHLATITIGLLIAISLEQTVEWVHHLHQRHQLEADLRQEGIQNRDLFQGNLQVVEKRMAITAAKLRAVESTLAMRKKMPPPFVDSTFPADTSRGVYINPLESVWVAAKESALINLLPKETARSYTRVYFESDMLITANNESIEALSVVQGYECLSGDGTLPCKPNLERMANEQLAEYGEALARYFLRVQTEKLRLLYFEAADSTMLEGRSVDAGAGLKEAQRLRSVYPDTFLVPTPKAN